MSDDKPHEIVRYTMPQISAAAVEIINLLRSTDEGVTVTFDEFSAAAGFNIREKRGPLQTAIKRVLADDGVHMASVRGVGYRRLTTPEAAGTLSADLTKSRNAARKGMRKAQQINVLEIPPEKRATFVAQSTLCMLISESTKQKQQAKLIAAASTKNESTAILAQREALEALNS